MEGTISFILGGADRDNKAVTLPDLSKYIDTFTECLRRLETRMTGESAVLRHVVVEMHVGSAAVTSRAISPHREPELGRQVYTEFRQTIRALENGERVNPRLGNEDLRAFRKLAAPIWNRRRRVEVAGVELTTRFIANIDTILRSETSSLGSVKGRIEKLNLHNRHEFTLYPPVGEVAVQCIFPDELFERVHESVNRTVTVYGLVFYKGDGPFPERVQVQSIETHARDAELPTLGSLRGLIPGLTTGGASVGDE